MEMVLIMVVASAGALVLGAIAVCYWLFAPHYEHRNSFLGESDIPLDSRFEKLWNRKQDEIEARSVCRCAEFARCPVHPEANKIIAVSFATNNKLHNLCKQQ